MLQEMGGIEAYGSFRRFRFAGVFEPQALPSYRPKKRLQAATGYKPSRCPLAAVLSCCFTRCRSAGDAF
jgi:hypothetical protein